MSDIITIGVDHGYAAMKTAHFSFPTGLVEYEDEPYTPKDVLEYNRPLLDEHGVPYDIVCGTFFVAGLSGETFTSLTEDQLRCYKELFDNHIVLTVPAQSQPEKTHPKKGKKYER